MFENIRLGEVVDDKHQETENFKCFCLPSPFPLPPSVLSFFVDGYGFPTGDGKHKNVCMCRNERLPLEVLMPKINTRLPHGLVEECLHHGKPLCMNCPLSLVPPFAYTNSLIHVHQGEGEPTFLPVVYSHGKSAD